MRQPRRIRERVAAPTRETMRHGDYRQADGRWVRAPYVNRTATYCAQLRRNGTITKKQQLAGDQFGDTYRYVWGSPTRDSCVLRVGGVAHETDAQAARHAGLRASLHGILNRCGPRAYSLLVQVCAFDEPLGKNRGANRGKYDELVKGLNAAAIVFEVED